MKKGILLHNLFHIYLPFILVYIIFKITPDLNPPYVLISVFIGAFIPDIDHFTMYRKFYYKNFLSFLEFCLTANRFRKGFLLFHNHLVLLFVAVFMLISLFINFYLTLFLFAFLFHLVYDYLSDILLIKSHAHWKFKSWL